VNPVLSLYFVGLLSSAEFYLEAGPYPSRGDANAVAAALDADPPSRVVRRFKVGAGWEYVVRVGAFEDEDSLRAYASRSVSVPMVLLERVGPNWRPLDGASSAADAEESDLVVIPGEVARTSVLLRAAVKAHGGREGGLSLLDLAPTVVFDYQRTVSRDDGQTIAEHHYARAGEAIRLDVDVTSGPGVDSHSVLTPNRRAWVSTDSTSISRDPERTAEVLERFSPEGLLAIPLGIPRDMESSGPWRLLEPTARAAGERWLVQAEMRDGGHGLVAADFGLADHLLRRLVWTLDTGEVSYEFDEYRTVAHGLVVPFSYEVHRGGKLIESVTVRRLEIGSALPADTFEIPEPADSPTTAVPVDMPAGHQ
jgi:hypothetical protein